MATVHRAELRGIAGFRRELALKRMLGAYCDDPQFVEMFVREATLACNLNHVNIPRTYSLGKVGDIYYIAMELAPGPTLRHLQRQCVGVAGAIPLTITMSILEQVCAALDYAHKLADKDGKPLGIIHRDVTPSNVILSNGTVKLIDFGIAKAALDGTKTQVGTVKGKFSYMAPEYMTEGKLDARADLFALGVIGHELLTTRPLFTGDSDFDTLSNVRGMKVEPPSKRNSDVPPELDDIIMTALARDPEQRWQQASAMRTALASVIQQRNLSVTRKQTAEWVDWALELSRRPDTPAAAHFNTGDYEKQPPATVALRKHPPTPEVVVVNAGDDELPPFDSPEIPTGATTNVHAEIWRRKRSVIPWIVLAICLVAGVAAGAVAHFVFDVMR
jgi:serine/threonine-protein kinase